MKFIRETFFLQTSVAKSLVEQCPEAEGKCLGFLSQKLSSEVVLRFIPVIRNVSCN